MTLNFTYTIMVLSFFLLSHFILHVKGWLPSLIIQPLRLVGEQTASTDNRFNTLGQGSCPKLLFDTVTVHLGFPIHFFSRVAWEVEE